MKRLANVIVLTIVLFVVFMMAFGKLKIYDPEHNEIRISVASVETGSKLVGVTEVNAVLIIMLAGAFILFK